MQQDQYQVPAVAARDGLTAIPAQQVHGTIANPYLPASIGPSVLAILGLTNYAPFSDDLTHTPKGVSASSTITPTATYTGNLTPADFAKTYDLGPLYTAASPARARRSASSRWRASTRTPRTTSGTTCWT